MPPIQAIAPTHCFREFSPEVPPEVKAQLDLGDPPDLLKANAHPIARLLWQHSKRQQAEALYLAKAIGGEKNVNKSIRCIREVFSGERLHPFWIKHLAESLAIPPEDLAKARERAVEWEAERADFDLRQQRHRLFARLGPYVKIISTALPATEAKPPADPRPRLSCEVFSIPGDPDLSEISEWIASHSNTASWGENITGYLYHRHPEEIYLFGREGEMLGKRNIECSEAGIFGEI
jgi:hypothetical protein